MSRQLDWGKDSHSTKIERSPRIFVKLSFRELFDSKLSRLYLSIPIGYAPYSVRVPAHLNHEKKKWITEVNWCLHCWLWAGVCPHCYQAHYGTLVGHKVSKGTWQVQILLNKS